ncbi:MAG: hypothetical protein NTV47_04390 [Actinobacteria bacterium]|nr:hypothetical protein [Actinomycetota bacterium]
MIINEVEHGKNFKHEQIVFKPELVIRASTQASPATQVTRN